MDGENKDIMRFAGAWKHISDKGVEEMKKRILKIRKESTRALMENRKRF